MPKNKDVLLALMVVLAVFILAIGIYNMHHANDIRIFIECVNNCRIVNAFNPGSCLC